MKFYQKLMAVTLLLGSNLIALHAGANCILEHKDVFNSKRLSKKLKHTLINDPSKYILESGVQFHNYGLKSVMIDSYKKEWIDVFGDKKSTYIYKYRYELFRNGELLITTDPFEEIKGQFYDSAQFRIIIDFLTSQQC